MKNWSFRYEFLRWSITMKKRAVTDYAVPPGATLLETIEALGISQTDLAARTGRPKKTINEIIHGRAAITADTAIQFERVLGIPASFWLSLEANYREALARESAREQLK
jgi:addiction module HigA family antidote